MTTELTSREVPAGSQRWGSSHHIVNTRKLPYSNNCQVQWHPTPSLRINPPLLRTLPPSPETKSKSPFPDFLHSQIGTIALLTQRPVLLLPYFQPYETFAEAPTYTPYRHVSAHEHTLRSVAVSCVTACFVDLCIHSFALYCVSFLSGDQERISSSSYPEPHRRPS